MTGHTGFKGSWLCAWLARPRRRGRPATRWSHRPNQPLRGLGLAVRDGSVAARRRGDVRDLRRAAPRRVAEVAPEVVFHLAAQPLVRRSYAEPHETLRDQRDGHREPVRGGARLPVGASRRVVTSDKCYENRRRPAGPIRETDAAGRPRPVQREQGLRRAGHGGLPAQLLRRGRRWRGDGPRRQRDRRRRLGARPDRARLRAGRWRPASPSSCATPAPCGPGSTCSSRWPATLAGRAAAGARASASTAPGTSARPDAPAGGRRRGWSALPRGVGRAVRGAPRAAGPRAARGPALSLLDSAKAATSSAGHPRLGRSTTADRADGCLVQRRAADGAAVARDAGRCRQSPRFVTAARPTLGLPWATAFAAATTGTVTIVSTGDELREQIIGPGRALLRRGLRAGGPALAAPGTDAAGVRCRARRACLTAAASSAKRRSPTWSTPPRLLADRRPLRGALRARARRTTSASRTACSSIRVVGQPGGLHGARPAQARRAPPQARRRGHHRGRRLSHARWRRSCSTAPVPVFVDVDSATANVDAAQLPRRSRPRTRP